MTLMTPDGLDELPEPRSQATVIHSRRGDTSRTTSEIKQTDFRADLAGRTPTANLCYWLTDPWTTFAQDDATAVAALGIRFVLSSCEGPVVLWRLL